MSLCNEEPSVILDVLIQFKQIVAGTHKAIPIQAPEVKQHTKGRPMLSKRSMASLTKRNPSAFEIVESELKKNSSKKRPARTQKTKSKQMKKDNYSSSSDDSDHDLEDQKNYISEDKESQTNKISDVEEENIENQESREDNGYFSQVPIPLHKYIKNFFDPLGDGNCGFWCIAQALGYGNNGWLQV